MGTRVAILCTDGKSVSVEVYKHYDGCDAPEIIARANGMSPMRPIKPEQASALVAACAVNIEIEQAGEFEATFDGKLTASSLQRAPCIRAADTRAAILAAFAATGADAKAEALSRIRELARERLLGAGVVIVDVRTKKWSWQAFAGELEEHPLSGFSDDFPT